MMQHLSTFVNIYNRDYVRDTSASKIDLFGKSNYPSYVEFDLGNEINWELLNNGDEMLDFRKDAYSFILAVEVLQ